MRSFPRRVLGRIAVLRSAGVFRADLLFCFFYGQVRSITRLSGDIEELELGRWHRGFEGKVSGPGLTSRGSRAIVDPAAGTRYPPRTSQPGIETCAVNFGLCFLLQICSLSLSLSLSLFNQPPPPHPKPPRIHLFQNEALGLQRRASSGVLVTKASTDFSKTLPQLMGKSKASRGEPKYFLINSFGKIESRTGVSGSASFTIK